MNITQLTRKAAFAPVFIACLNLLALALWYMQARTIASKPAPVSIRHFLPREKGDDIFAAPVILKRYSTKRQVQFQLGRYPDDTAALNAIEISALGLKQRSDTNRIIKVNLTDQASYEQLIALINIVRRNNIKRYMLWENDFYIVPGDPKSTLSLFYF